MDIYVTRYSIKFYEKSQNMGSIPALVQELLTFFIKA